MSCSFLLRMRNVSDKLCICLENQNTYFGSVTFFEIRAVCEVMWKNIVERGRPQRTIWRIHIARWGPKATNAHPEYVILIVFPLQQWLHEGASMLRNT